MRQGTWLHFWLAAGILFGGVCPPAGRAAPSLPTVSVLNLPDGSRVTGTDQILKLRVSPPPASGHPDHFHLYVNGRMVKMFTMTRATLSVSLHHLPKGRDRITILSADPTTHRLIGGSGEGQIGGTDTGDMGAMDMSEMRTPPRKIALGTRFVLIVR